MAELHPEQAKDAAQSARQFLAAFINEDFGELAKPGSHDRRHLAIALDHLEVLSAMVLNLAERVPPNDLGNSLAATGRREGEDG